MNTPITKFGSRCDVSDKFIEKVAKMGVMDAACAITEVKENKAAKKTDGTKRRKITGIPKLDDANWAGTERSRECMIIFCEGDSAKTGVISGLSSEARNTIGVYPLKGKLMNVRGEAVKNVIKNVEINEIKQILGLESGRTYESIEDVYKRLRYGKIVFMTDQDLDGSHIKGLGINLFQSEWPSLTHIPGFIGFMNTPILKAKKGSQELKFYNDGEYEEWKQTNDIRGWNIKYYKGLGTSNKIEWKEYFQEKKFIGFEHNGEQSDDAIDMVFNKKRADDRKHWLETIYNRSSFADTRKQMISYEEFINRELIHFSKYDCDRSIPNLMDGLKISLRKILYSAFKKRLTSEIKVAQFSGYVSEQSCYHHGEDSLNKAIVGMAQNFVGSNNINLLFPSGQFGSRIKGGQDASSPRYIFTRLEKIARIIFPEQDDAILNYLNDDGTLVEPQFYVPIIPMVLINGSKGIGTGFSTEIMCYNPRDIIAYLKNKLLGQSNESITFFPYYEGFNGEITKINEKKYLFRGSYHEIDENTICVTELPVGFWTDDFKELLDDLQLEKDDKGNKLNPVIKDFNNKSTDTTVQFIITFARGKLAELKESKGDYGCNGLEKLLKLYNTGSNTNMNLFTSEDKLKKYNDVSEIIDDYYEVRLNHYDIRKQYIIRALTKDALILSNRARYIQELLDGTIDLRKKKKQEIMSMLAEKNYDIIDEDNEYKYLVKMAMDSVSEENVEKLLKEQNEKIDELERVKLTTIEQMWLSELDILEQEYVIYQRERIQSLNGDGIQPTKKKQAVKKMVKKSKVKTFIEEEEN
jgi:DNA topoisomerase-2